MFRLPNETPETQPQQTLFRITFNNLPIFIRLRMPGQVVLNEYKDSGACGTRFELRESNNLWQRKSAPCKQGRCNFLRPYNACEFCVFSDHGPCVTYCSKWPEMGMNNLGAQVRCISVGHSKQSSLWVLKDKLIGMVAGKVMGYRTARR